jgi:hypothetical protein
MKAQQKYQNVAKYPPEYDKRNESPTKLDILAEKENDNEIQKIHPQKDVKQHAQTDSTTNSPTTKHRKNKKDVVMNNSLN